MNRQKEEIVPKIPLVVWHPNNASCDINIDLYNAKIAYIMRVTIVCRDEVLP